MGQRAAAATRDCETAAGVNFKFNLCRFTARGLLATWGDIVALEAEVGSAVTWWRAVMARTWQAHEAPSVRLLVYMRQDHERGLGLRNNNEFTVAISKRVPQKQNARGGPTEPRSCRRRCI